MPSILDLCIDILAMGESKKEKPRRDPKRSKRTGKIVQKSCMERGLKRCSVAAFGGDGERSLIQSTSLEDPFDFSDVTPSTLSSSNSSCGNHAGDSERCRENQAEPSVMHPISSNYSVSPPNTISRFTVCRRRLIKHIIIDSCTEKASKLVCCVSITQYTVDSTKIFK